MTENHEAESADDGPQKTDSEGVPESDPQGGGSTGVEPEASPAADTTDETDEIDEFDENESPGEAEAIDDERDVAPDTDAEAEADTAAEELSDDASDEGIQPGDFIKLSYTARTVESDQLVDTTDEAVAEEEGVAEDDRSFAPRTIVVGEGHVFSPVDDDLVGKSVGDAGTVIVPVEDAFGEGDPDEVRTVSADKIPEDDRYPGAHVTVDGDHGHIETIIGGRARVDFNHPLAGQEIEYTYEIVDTVDDRIEKAKGLFEMYVDVTPEMWIQTDEVEEEVTIPPDEVEDDAEDPETTETETDESTQTDTAADEGAEPELTEPDDAETTPVESDPPEPRTETRVVEKETLYVESTPQLAMNQQWLFSKQQIGTQLIDRLGVDRIVIQEIIDDTGGMGGMFGGMGGMGAPGGGGDVEDVLEEADVDADEIAEELEPE